MTDLLAEFADAATRYCEWRDCPAETEIEDARAAQRHLLRLYHLALDLRQVDDAPEVDYERVDHDAWKSAYERFANLPVGFYHAVAEPLDTDAEEVDLMMLDVADDLADIFRDVSGGLLLYRAGHLESAEWEWAWSFQNHWGAHAAAAIHALHCWFAREDQW